MKTSASYLAPEHGVDKRWSDYGLRRLSSIACGGNSIDSSEKIFIRGVSECKFRKIISLPSGSIEWVSKSELLPPGANLDIPKEIPVLFRAEGSQRGDKVIEKTGDRVYFNLDFIAATFFMLSRWEEYIIDKTDNHNRFSIEHSAAYKEGFLDRPIIDEYALILRAWIKHLNPDWSAPKRRFQINLTHDVDYISHYNSLKQLLRRIGYLAIREKKWKESIKIGMEGTKAIVRPLTDDFYRGIKILMSTSEKYNLRSTFYFMTAVPGTLDDGYNLDRRKYRALLDEICRRRHNIGLHLGYHTFNDFNQMKREKHRLAVLLGKNSFGTRQHYLRFKVPCTWQLQEKCGLKHDSTGGFSKQAGFRCGTCYPYYPYDFKENKEIALLEIPLIVMDKTLISTNCMGLSIDRARKTILYFADCCWRMGGVFTIAWHNSFVCGEWDKWFRMYEDVVRVLSKKYLQS